MTHDPYEAHRAKIARDHPAIVAAGRRRRGLSTRDWLIVAALAGAVALGFGALIVLDAVGVMR